MRGMKRERVLLCKMDGFVIGRTVGFWEAVRTMLRFIEDFVCGSTAFIRAQTPEEVKQAFEIIYDYIKAKIEEERRKLEGDEG